MSTRKRKSAKGPDPMIAAKAAAASKQAERARKQAAKLKSTGSASKKAKAVLHLEMLSTSKRAKAAAAKKGEKRKTGASTPGSGKKPRRGAPAAKKQVKAPKEPKAPKAPRTPKAKPPPRASRGGRRTPTRRQQEREDEEGGVCTRFEEEVKNLTERQQIAYLTALSLEDGNGKSSDKDDPMAAAKAAAAAKQTVRTRKQADKIRSPTEPSPYAEHMEQGTIPLLPLEQTLNQKKRRGKGGKDDTNGNDLVRRFLEQNRAASAVLFLGLLATLFEFMGLGLLSGRSPFSLLFAYVLAPENKNAVCLAKFLLGPCRHFGGIQVVLIAAAALVAAWGWKPVNAKETQEVSRGGLLGLFGYTNTVVVDEVHAEVSQRVVSSPGLLGFLGQTEVHTDITHTASMEHRSWKVVRASAAAIAVVAAWAGFDFLCGLSFKRGAAALALAAGALCVSASQLDQKWRVSR